MDETSNNQNKKLLSLMNYGLGLQSVSVIVDYCVRNNKTDFLTKLNDLISSLVSGLSNDEKKDLQKDIDTMLEKKSDEFAEELNKTFKPEEKDQVIAELQSLTK